MSIADGGPYMDIISKNDIHQDIQTALEHAHSFYSNLYCISSKRYLGFPLSPEQKFEFTQTPLNPLDNVLARMQEIIGYNYLKGPWIIVPKKVPHEPLLTQMSMGIVDNEGGLINRNLHTNGEETHVNLTEHTEEQRGDNQQNVDEGKNCRIRFNYDKLQNHMWALARVMDSTDDLDEVDDFVKAITAKKALKEKSEKKQSDPSFYGCIESRGHQIPKRHRSFHERS